MSVTNNDIELCEYIFRIIYYIMQGNPKEDCLFLLYGPSTRNGKSTLVNALISAFGNYAITAQPEMISKRSISDPSKPRPELVRIRGARLINIAEPSNNQHLDVGLLKTLTGRDLIAARPLYSEIIEFKNNGVFLIHTNHLPVVDDNTLFTSKRVIVIPFDVHFEEKDIDRDMLKKLTTEEAISGLLYEIYKINKKYGGIGIKEKIPQRVLEANFKFASESDYFGLFIEEKITKERGGFAYLHGIYNAYQKWKEINDYPSLSKKELSKQLEKRGYTKKRRNDGVGFMDIVLI